jgi:hypothetical protein
MTDVDSIVYDMSIQSETEKFPFLKKSVPYMTDNNSNSNYNNNEIVFEGLLFTIFGKNENGHGGENFIDFLLDQHGYFKFNCCIYL